METSQKFKCILCGFISEGVIFQLYEHLEEKHGMENAEEAELEKCCVEVGEEEDSARGGSPLSPAGSPFSVFTTHSKSSSTDSQTLEPTFQEPIPHSSFSASPTSRSASRAPGVDESLTDVAPSTFSLAPPPPQTSEMEGSTDVLDLGPDSVVDVGTQTNTYICSICEYRGRDSFALRRHINSLHKAK